MKINIAILLALSFAWASNYLGIASADAGLEALTASAAITLVAALFLFVGIRLCMRRELLPTLRANPVVSLIMALTAVGLPQLSTVMAENSISPDMATVIGTAVPILTFLVAACVFRTTPASVLNFLGVGIAVAGIVVFADPDKLMQNQSELKGIAIMLAGGVVFVANGLYAARRTADLDQYALTFWIVAFSSIGLAVAALVFDGMPKGMPARSDLLGVAFSGLLGTGLAYLLYYLLIARAGAAFTSLYAFLVPPLGVVVAALAGEGELTVRHLSGVAIVLVGLWLIMRAGPDRRSAAE
ncbi:MAG: DMT family transporter [Alphaproteobacteria bacterium]|jgi:drug/metabolite transporter (DMT)-like permease